MLINFFLDLHNYYIVPKGGPSYYYIVAKGGEVCFKVSISFPSFPSNNVRLSDSRVDGQTILYAYDVLSLSFMNKR